jgi:hypothetical protein
VFGHCIREIHMEIILEKYIWECIVFLHMENNTNEIVGCSLKDLCMNMLYHGIGNTLCSSCLTIRMIIY